jgi:O-antigen biosynthesis protein WbqP
MYLPIKRLGDFFSALAGIILLLPVMLLLAVIIKIDSRGPVLFCQKRIGAGKTHFMMYKFRTMRTNTPKDMPTHMLKDPGSHITRAGRLLRRTSLDELPQLFNILRGDMSVIGPRPALWNQDDLLAERDRYGANALRPGLTGWAQINGRDELPIPVKARLDGVYVARMSFLFDCEIFFKTIFVALGGKGLSEGGPPV